MTCGASNVDIYCRSYDGDADWLEYTLPTWIKHKPDGMRITITGEPCKSERIREIAKDNHCRFFMDMPAAAIRNGYINQQYSKMRAYLVCYADYVLFLDSDTIAEDDFTPEMFFKDSKPLWLYSDWDKVGDAICWKDRTEHAYGKTPPYEFMRRLPMLVPRNVLIGLVDYMRAVHGKDLVSVLREANGFSEFNAMGMYAWDCHHDEFTWVNPQEEHVDPIPFKQFWSWGNMKEQLAEYER